MSDHEAVPKRRHDLPLYAVSTHQPGPPRVYLTPLLGREGELDALASLLASGDARLITLLGPGGVGKTRLAQELLERVAANSRDGAWFVPLAAISNPELIPSAIARTIGVQARGDRPVVDVLTDVLRHRRSLLVLDNMEHLLSGSMAWLVELLVACPDLRVVATSRSALRLTGERRFPIDPLAVPIAGSGVDSRDHAAVALFLQRAHAVLPDGELTDPDVETIAEICRRLDGLPLAIELAAARVNVLTPRDMLGQLSDRFALLSGGARDAPARLRSMHDAISWSHDLLSPDEQRVFRRLAVFSGGFTLDAAATVTADPGSDVDQVVLVIESLVDQSLVKRVPASEGSARFGMLETIREFSARQLDASGESDVTRDRHAAWCIALAEEMKPAWQTSAQRRAADRLELEHNNLRAALAWLSSRDDHGAFVHLVSLAWFFWFVRNHFTEGRRWVDLAETWSTSERSRERAAILTAVHALSWGQYDATRAQAVDDELRSLATIAAPFGMDSVVIPIAINASVRGDPEEAVRVYEAGLDAYARAVTTEPSDQGWAGVVLCNMANEMLAHGDLERARQLIEESLVLHRASGHTWGMVVALLASGVIVEKAGDPARARGLYRESLALALQENDHRKVLGPLCRLVAHAGMAGEAINSARWLGKVEDLHELLGRAVTPWLESEMRAVADRARAQLGDAAFEAAWAEGKAAPLDAIVAEACATGADLTMASSDAGPGLTAREMDVLRMVANGLTDRQIAEALFISRRTVNSHVGNLLAKLLATSRRAAVRHAIEQGLLPQDTQPPPYT